jgi:thioredoxin reductase (NADPH)
MSPVLTLYTREGCLLCLEMEHTLAQALAERPPPTSPVIRVDVDADPRLAARFGARVPILYRGEEEICHYRLDETALARLWTGKAT